MEISEAISRDFGINTKSHVVLRTQTGIILGQAVVSVAKRDDFSIRVCPSVAEQLGKPLSQE